MLPQPRRLYSRAMRTRLLARLPDPVQNTLRLAYVATRVTSDVRSLRTFARLARQPSRGDSRSTVALRLRPLSGREVSVRPATSDLATVWGTFARRYHLPPPEIGSPGTILDLGANIGLTMAHYACLFPHAHVVGVELDGDNAALARQNVAAWADRCDVIHAAVWPHDGEVHYRGWPGGTSNYQVTDLPEDVPVQAVSVATLLSQLSGPVDFLKIDIEGAEHGLLQAGDAWASQARSVKVELHGNYSVDDCEADLQHLGFSTRRDPNHRACVIGIRALQRSTRRRTPWRKPGYG